jgi:hypothetical protein
MLELVENTNKVIDPIILLNPVHVSCEKVIRAELFSFLYE